MLKPFF